MPNKLSRLGIFVFFDPQSIVDRYVIQLLQALRPSFMRLVVISNIALSEDAKALLEENCDAVFVRENRGLDAAAFKQGLTTFCGWDEVQKYDEVVLINDTFFGPIRSFDDMFAEMSTRDVDFWGMSAGYYQPDGWNWTKLGYIPDHIQTFFVAFRNNMVCSGAFQDYWNNYDDSLTTFQEVVSQHEMVMTKHFQDLGFRWDIYADSERYKSRYKDENFNLYFYHASRMMKDMNFPVLKRKVLSADIPELLYMRDLGDASDALEYISHNSDYDSDMIWENVLRLYNVADLYYSLNLNYVLPSAVIDPGVARKAALVFYITNPFFAEQFCEKAKVLAEDMPVYLIPETEAVSQIVDRSLDKAGKVRILKGTMQQTEMGGFLLGCKALAEAYTYLGFVHDLQNPNHYPTSVLESTVDNDLQNTAKDFGYVSQILHTFETNPKLGVLGTPFPIHHHGFGTYGNIWGEWFPATKQLAQSLQLHCNLTENKQPIMNTGAFWCRTTALQPLWKQNWKTTSFAKDPITLKNKNNEALKRILAYAAQSEGYYSGIVMHANYAAVRLAGQEFMLHEIVSTTRTQLKLYSDCYIGYRRQLQAYGTDLTSGGMKVDISQIGLRSMALILADRYLPKRVTNALLKIYRYFKRVLGKK